MLDVMKMFENSPEGQKTVGKGEIAHNNHLLLFHTVFSNDLHTRIYYE